MGTTGGIPRVCTTGGIPRVYQVVYIQGVPGGVPRVYHGGYPRVYLRENSDNVAHPRAILWEKAHSTPLSMVGGIPGWCMPPLYTPGRYILAVHAWYTTAPLAVIVTHRHG